MPECKHPILTLIKPRVQVKLRCRHCHLTLSEEELGGGDCPECLEAKGLRRRDFEPVEAGSGGPVRYRCEQCGLLIG